MQNNLLSVTDYENTDIGPLINEDSYKKVVREIEDAVSKGAKVLTGATYDVDEEKKCYCASYYSCKCNNRYGNHV